MGLLPVDGTITIGGRHIARAEDAVDRGVGLVFQNPDDQLFGATGASAWLVATTRPDEIIAALRRLGVPAALVELLALAARYVSVLGESLRSAREAQRARLGWQGLGARLRSFGALVGIVVARAIDQSDAIADAMRVRGGGRR
jgi:cobalt/nickel transport system permease protein